MTPIGDHNAAAALQLPVMLPPQFAALGGDAESSTGLAPRSFSLRASNHPSDELRKQFTQFVGETFYGQMIKAMRSSVGKPAYFHGGRAEEVFQGQLDQEMAEHLTETTAEKVAEPLFERQFPHFSERSKPNDLSQLTQLRQR